MIKLDVARSILVKIYVQPEQELKITAYFIDTPILLNQWFFVSLPYTILVNLSGNICLHVFKGSRMWFVIVKFVSGLKV